MIKKISYLGLLVILPLFTVALVTTPFEEAEARNKEIGNVKLEEPEPDVNLTLKQPLNLKKVKVFQ